MSEINYKEEVLKVCPDAYCFEGFYPPPDDFYFVICIDLLGISAWEDTEQSAWESAYNKLKQEGKI